MVPAASILVLFLLVASAAAAASSSSQEAGGEEPDIAVTEIVGPETPPLVRKTREDGPQETQPAPPRSQDGPASFAAAATAMHGPVLPGFVTYGGSLAPAQVMYRSSQPYSVYYLPQSAMAARSMGAIPASTGLLDLSLDTPHASLHKGLLIQHPLGPQQQPQPYSNPTLAYCRTLLGQTDMTAYPVQQPQLPPAAPAYQHYTSYVPAY